MIDGNSLAKVMRGSDYHWEAAMGSLVLCLVVLGIAFYGTFADIVFTWWKTGTFAHGFLVLPIVIYLIWEKRQALESMNPKPRKAALWLVLLLLVIWFFAYILDVLVVMQFAVMALIVALVWMLLGNEVTKKLAFPLCYLFFAVPFGDFLIPTLQDITAVFSVKALQLSSIPVYLEGRYFYIPSGSFEVEEGCSGVRYLIASICLGTLYAYLSFNSIKRRVIFIIFCAVVPIVANAIRAYGIVMIAHLSDYKLAVGVDHIIYGWVFFGVVIFFVFWVGSHFRDSEISQVRAPPAVNKANSYVTNHFSLPLAAVLMMVSSSLLANWFYSIPENMIPELVEFDFPKSQARWEGPSESASDWYPVFHGATHDQKVQYISGGKQVDVYIAYYIQQRQDAELINTKNKLFDGNWKRTTGLNTKIDIKDVGQWSINELVITSTRENRIIWYWYGVGGRYTANSIMAKLLDLPVRLLRKNTGAEVYAVSIKYDVDINAGRKELRDFLNNILLSLFTTVNRRDPADTVS